MKVCKWDFSKKLINYYFKEEEAEEWWNRKWWAIDTFLPPTLTCCCCLRHQYRDQSNTFFFLILIVGDHHHHLLYFFIYNDFLLFYFKFFIFSYDDKSLFFSRNILKFFKKMKQKSDCRVGGLKVSVKTVGGGCGVAKQGNPDGPLACVVGHFQVWIDHNRPPFEKKKTLFCCCCCFLGNKSNVVVVVARRQRIEYIFHIYIFKRRSAWPPFPRSFVLFWIFTRALESFRENVGNLLFLLLVFSEQRTKVTGSILDLSPMSRLLVTNDGMR